MGWRTESGTVIAANTVIDLDAVDENEMRLYDADGDGTVTFTAVWSDTYEDGKFRNVNFYVLMDANTADTAINAGTAVMTTTGAYTDSIYATMMIPREQSKSRDDPANKQYVEGDGYTICSQTKVGVLAADSTIRQLGTSGIAFEDGTLYQTLSFPTDEEVFARLRELQASGKCNCTLDHQTIPAEELTPENYTIRWYVAKYLSGNPAANSWHIDGKLTPRISYVTITKTFAGDEFSMARIPEDYEIVLTNAANEEDTIRLRLEKKTGANTAESGLLDSGTNAYGWMKKSGNTYTWVVRASANAEYQVVENNYAIDGYGIAAYYSMTDFADETRNRDLTQWFGTISGFSAKYPRDEVNVRSFQTTNLFNTYVKTGEFVIQKRDSDAYSTAMPGVHFTIKDDKGQIMRLSKEEGSDPEDGEYTVLYANGSVSDIARTNADGNIYLTLPRPESGTYTFYIYETVPEGYQTASEQPSFRLTVDTDGNYTVDDIRSGAGTVSVTKLVPPGGNEEEGKVTGVLVTNVPQTISAKITKVWECEPEESVTMVLTGTTGTETREFGEVVLNDANEWTYTWNELPLVIGNQVVKYTVRETKIDAYELGSDAFLHWIPQYITPVYKDAEGEILSVNGTTVSDEDAYKVRSIDFEVRNDAQEINDVTIKIIKKDASDQSKEIDGAVFQIYEARETGNPISIQYNDETVQVKDNGYVRTFSGLDLKFHYNRDYYIREIEAPAGYAVLDGFIRIRVEPTGHIEVDKEKDIEDYVNFDTEHNLVAELTVLDIPMEVKLVKTLMGTQTPLAGAHFSMYAVTGDTVSEHPVAGFEDIVTKEDGIIYAGGLPPGTYDLVETQAPAGCTGLDAPVRLTVTTTKISAFLQSETPKPMGKLEEKTVQNGDRTDIVKKTYVVEIPNSIGYELPATGGPGTKLIYLYGAMLTALAATGLLLKRYLIYRRKL